MIKPWEMGAFQVWGKTWHNSLVLVIGGEMERYG
jgi:hypothetical protein